MSRTGNFFIVMRIDLKTDPAVLAMAVELKERPEVVVGYLHSIWGWFSITTMTGIVHGVSVQGLEVATNLNGFPQLMEKYGWLKEWRDDNGAPSVEIPEWDRWFGGSSQRKEYEKQRKRAQRANVRDNVRDKTGTSGGRFAPTGTGTGTGTGNKSSAALAAFSEFWNAYPKRKGRRVGKKEASSQFAKIAEVDYPSLMMAVEHYAVECNGLPKDASRFLRSDFWRDYASDPPADNQDQIDELNKALSQARKAHE